MGWKVDMELVRLRDVSGDVSVDQTGGLPRPDESLTKEAEETARLTHKAVFQPNKHNGAAFGEALRDGCSREPILFGAD